MNGARCRLYRVRCDSEDVSEIARLHAYIEDGLLVVNRPIAQQSVAQQAAGYVAMCEVLEQVGIGVLSRAPSKLQIEEMCNVIRTLYTPPPSLSLANANAGKPWVGLTNDDVKELFEDGLAFEHYTKIYKAIEAKLREKNA